MSNDTETELATLQHKVGTVKRGRAQLLEKAKDNLVRLQKSIEEQRLRKVRKNIAPEPSEPGAITYMTA